MQARQERIVLLTDAQLAIALVSSLAGASVGSVSVVANCFGVTISLSFSALVDIWKIKLKLSKRSFSNIKITTK